MLHLSMLPWSSARKVNGRRKELQMSGKRMVMQTWKSVSCLAPSPNDACKASATVFRSAPSGTNPSERKSFARPQESRLTKCTSWKMNSVSGTTKSTPCIDEVSSQTWSRIKAEEKIQMATWEMTWKKETATWACNYMIGNEKNHRYSFGEELKWTIIILK